METISNTIDEHERDRISELPDEILHHILSFMTTKSSVAASILSSRWRHLWKYISTIHFDSFPYRPIGTVDYSFVDQTLDHLRAPRLHKFIVVATVRGDIYTNHLFQKWVDFAVERSVEVLILDFKTSPLPDIVFDLPSSFYTPKTQSLKQISLGCAHLDPPLSFQGLVSLKALRLWRCKLTDDIVHELVLKCKLLESLTIDKCRTLKNVRIFGPSDMRLRHFTFVCRSPGRVFVQVDAPNLVSLKYCGNLRMICLGYLPCLLEAKLFHDSLSVLDSGSVKSLLDDKLSHVKLLGVDYWLLRFLAEEQSTNGRRWRASKNVKNVSWFGPLNKERDLSNLLAFIAHCPSLERIKIYSRYCDRDGITKSTYTYGFKDVFEKLEDGEVEPSVGSLYHLREVGFYYFSVYESEMEIIKRLLQKAVALESLTLTFEEPNKDGFTFKKELYQEQVGHSEGKSCADNPASSYATNHGLYCGNLVTLHSTCIRKSITTKRFESIVEA